MTKNFYVYILASENGTLYVGITNNLQRRIYEHKMNMNEGFTKKYKCYKLVYFEVYNSPNNAILREKQIKRWRRSKKCNIIRNLNPDWIDLSYKY